MKKKMMLLSLLMLCSCGQVNNSEEPSTGKVPCCDLILHDFNETYEDNLGNYFSISDIRISDKSIFVDGNFNLVNNIDIKNIYLSVIDGDYHEIENVEERFKFYLKTDNHTSEIIGKQTLEFPISDLFYLQWSNYIHGTPIIRSDFGIDAINRFKYFDSYFFSNQVGSYVIDKIPSLDETLNYRDFIDYHYNGKTYSYLNSHYEIYGVYIDSKNIYLDGYFELDESLLIKNINIEVIKDGMVNYTFALKENYQLNNGVNRLVFPISDDYYKVISSSYSSNEANDMIRFDLFKNGSEYFNNNGFKNVFMKRSYTTKD